MAFTPETAKKALKKLNRYLKTGKGKDGKKLTPEGRRRLEVLKKTQEAIASGKSPKKGGRKPPKRGARVRKAQKLINKMPVPDKVFVTEEFDRPRKVRRTRKTKRTVKRTKKTVTRKRPAKKGARRTTKRRATKKGARRK